MTTYQCRRHPVAFTQECEQVDVGSKCLRRDFLLAVGSFWWMITPHDDDADVAGVGAADMSSLCQHGYLREGGAVVHERTTLIKITGAVNTELVSNITPSSNVLVQVLHGPHLSFPFLLIFRGVPGSMMPRHIVIGWTCQVDGRATERLCTPGCPVDERRRNDCPGLQAHQRLYIGRRRLFRVGPRVKKTHIPQQDGTTFGTVSPYLERRGWKYRVLSVSCHRSTTRGRCNKVHRLPFGG